MRLSEIGQRIREQRRALGLTQEQLARLSELSRTTVNQMENGTLADLGYAKLSHLLAVLGLDLEAKPATGLEHALAVAARTASTSYKKPLAPETLAEMLASGEAPDEYRPHLMTLLDETPLPVVIKAIQEAAQRSPATTRTPRPGRDLPVASNQPDAEDKIIGMSRSAFVNVVVASSQAACFRISGRIRSGFNQT